MKTYLPLQSPRTYNIGHSEGFTSIKLHGFLTVHPRAEPYRIEHSSSQFGSARILFEPYIVEREHCDPRFGSARARKFRAGRRFGSTMLGTVRFGSGMYGTVSPVWLHRMSRQFWQRKSNPITFILQSQSSYYNLDG